DPRARRARGAPQRRDAQQHPRERGSRRGPRGGGGAHRERGHRVVLRRERRELRARHRAPALDADRGHPLRGTDPAPAGPAACGPARRPRQRPAPRAARHDGRGGHARVRVRGELPVSGEHSLAGGPDEYAWLTAGFGVGSIAAGVVLLFRPWTGLSRMIVVTVGYALALAVTAAAPGTRFANVTIVLVGACSIGFLTTG